MPQPSPCSRLLVRWHKVLKVADTRGIAAPLDVDLEKWILRATAFFNDKPAISKRDVTTLDFILANSMLGGAYLAGSGWRCVRPPRL